MERRKYLIPLVLALSSPSAAYVDPGVWASLFQAAYLAILVAVAFVTTPLRALLRFFRGDTNSEDDSQEPKKDEDPETAEETETADPSE